MNKRKTVLLLTAAALLLAATVGGTYAFLSAGPGTVVNTFSYGEVVPEIEEDFDDGKVKNDVFIWNSGNVNAYVRAAVVVTWKDAQGNVAPVAPVENQDYVITLPAGDGWTKGSDGFYYYSGVVQPSAAAPENAGTDASTTVLLTGCQLKTGATPPDGYTLSVDIFAQAIQAEGLGASGAQDAWQKAMASGASSGN